MKSFIVYNHRLTEKGNTTVILKTNTSSVTFGGIQVTSAKGTYCWISLSGNLMDSFPIGKEIQDVPASATIDTETGELILRPTV